MDIRTFIDLRISGIGLDIQGVSDGLKMLPDKSYTKGDIFIDHKHGGKETVYEEDCWIMGIESVDEESAEQLVNRFLAMLLPSADYLKKIATIHNATIWLSVFPDGEQLSIHLSEYAISKIHELGVSFDYTVMFLKQLYDGNY